MLVTIYRRADTSGRVVPELPCRKSDEAAGYDITVFSPYQNIPLSPLTPTIIETGLYLAPPAGATVLLTVRSGLAAKGIVVLNGPGIIDSDYRGEIKVLMMYLAPPSSIPFTLHHGDRIGQLLFLPRGVIDQNVVFDDVKTLDGLPSTARGAGGFGSTGR